jgi:integrase
MRHYYGPSTVSTPKAALALSDLRSVAPLLDLTAYEDARDWCAFLFAFFALLRINEYMNGGLRHGHVRRTDGGVDITIVSSKTSQHPVTVSIASRGDILCPSSAYDSLLRAIESHHLPADPDTPLFVSRLDDSAQRVEPTTDAELVSRLRFYIGAALPGSDPSRYAGHSFRRGGATAMLLAGVQPSVIQRHGRWRSDTWRQYIDTFDNPAVRLIATRSLHP